MPPPRAAPPAPADGTRRRAGFVERAAPARAPRRRSPIERMQVEDAVDRLRRQAGRQRRLAADPPGRGARADRPVRLRQDDAAALAQPAHRADARRASLTGRITLDGDDIATLEPTALRRRVTMVFQQPNPFPMSVFDNVAYVLREQAARRPRKAALQGARARARSSAPACYDEVARRPRPPGAAALRRPAAAAVHRPRAGRRPRGAAARRAVLGARPALDPGDRGPDRASCARRSRS